MLSVLPWPRALGSAVVITTLGLAAHVSVADHAVYPLLVVGSRLVEMSLLDELAWLGSREDEEVDCEVAALSLKPGSALLQAARARVRRP